LYSYKILLKINDFNYVINDNKNIVFMNFIKSNFSFIYFYPIFLCEKK